MTEPVHLRPVTANDRQEFLDLMQASRHLHEPWIYPPLSNALYKHYLKRANRDDHVGLLVVESSTDAIAGVININNIVRGSFLSGSLGYYAGAPFAGRGYMTAGMRLVIRHAFKTLGLHRLEANIQPGNESSLALVKRCGFMHEGFSPRYLFIDGEWRDHERWTIIDKRRGLVV
ncbi:MAG: GNAT family protein [Pseudomonadales bacterium]|jgi:ribosomal-protein-alanine N-acetyltransferase|nr:GNAT family protein [Pseudomonadales bacterium]MDP6471339.1 GNAT family protein [Pseudomonadales bacterium]MDP6826470.1 GNAT family protein [Pseudomonadales bacterium]MDP6970075.1 GNAT family protein [Pseudomonadales bacterium]|tara:strand:+ start:3046 stop:3567 length:522 start_codon:yes stop_codon:yes gene_type:complete